MKTQLFRVVTGLVGAYHLVLGVAGVVLSAERVAQVVDTAFGVTLDLGDSTGMVARFTAVYLLAFGGMMLLVSLRPQKYRAFAWVALLLFGVRSINRLVFFGTLSDAGMSTARNATGTALLVAFFAAILLTLPKSEGSAASR